MVLINHYISHNTVGMITYPCLKHVRKMGPSNGLPAMQYAPSMAWVPYNMLIEPRYFYIVLVYYASFKS